jgi:hypothetical protein
MIFDHTPLVPLSPFDARFKRHGVLHDGTPAWPERATGRDSAENAAEVDAALRRPAKSNVAAIKSPKAAQLSLTRRDTAQYKSETTQRERSKACMRRLRAASASLNAERKRGANRHAHTAEQIDEAEKKAIANRARYNTKRNADRRAARVAAARKKYEPLHRTSKRSEEQIEEAHQRSLVLARQYDHARYHDPNGKRKKYVAEYMHAYYQANKESFKKEQQQ